MKKLSLLLFMLLFVLGSTWAQRTVSGTLTDDTGAPLIGANVLVKDTNVGTITDLDGKYELAVPKGARMLVFSYTGFGSKELSLGTGNVYNMTLSEGVTLADVVVTALGVKREKKSLGYSTQQVEGDEVTKTRTTNFVNNLSGKLSGVQIRANNNFGGSTDVVIRGNSSLTGDNQALFVIDGVPVNNANRNTSAQRYGSTGYDYGNAASDINPNDIESINVLKGAAATALYGSRAANGAIIITTKKGQRNQGIGVSVSSSATLGQIDRSTFITYQDEYGAGYGPYYGSTGYFEDVDVNGDGVDDFVVPTYDDASYGAKFDGTEVYQWDSFVPESPNFGKKYEYKAAENDPSYFFQNELTLSNSIEFSGGNENGAFRLGYTNFNTDGVLPNSELKKNIVNFSSDYNLTKKFKVAFSGTYFNQDALGRNSTGYSDNLMSQFRQWWQVNVDMKDLETLYDQTGRNVTWNAVAPWAGEHQPQYWDNPYWSRYENYQTDTRNRLLGNVTLTYEITDWLNVMGRVSTDTYKDLREERRAVGSISAPFGVNRADEASGYQRYNLDYTETNYDLLFTGQKNLTDDFSLKGIVGMNIRKSQDERVLSSTNGGLVVPGLYALSNSVGSLPNPTESLFEKEVHGYFGSVSLGYKNFLYLDATDRVDIASSLPAENNVYNYYSVSSGLVFSELVDLDALSFGKLRLSYAEVGNDAPALSVNDTYTKLDNFGSGSLFSVNSTKNNSTLKPERTKSLEAGLEMNFLKSRVGFDFAWYKNNTIDQIMPVAVSRTTGYSFKYVNAGEIENTGIELSLNFVPVKSRDFTWNSVINYTRNRNEVIELYEGVDNLELNSYQGGISINATKGQPYGTIRGTGFQYDDDGNKVLNESGYYISVADQVIGNRNPDFLAGWSNTLTFGNISLNFLLDMQQGGDVYTLDLHYGQGTGVIDYTAGLNAKGNPKRDPVADGGGIFNEGVFEDGTENTDTYVRADYYGGAYYWGNSARNPGQLTVYDASFIKLREVGLSYRLPSNLFSGVVKGGSISLVGRNVWIIQKHVPFADPESGLSSGNDQGYLSGSYPTVKTYGVNLNLDF